MLLGAAGGPQTHRHTDTLTDLEDLGGMLGNVGGILKIAGTQTGSVNNLAGTKKHKKCHFQPPFFGQGS